jgi:hypothetical protein
MRDLIRGSEMLTLVQMHAMQWLVKGAAPNDSLFFHCKHCLSFCSFSHYIAQILDMAAKPRITMVMRVTDLTKVLYF